MSENIAFSNRSYKINDNQWIESLSRRSNTSTWREKIIFTTNTHAHTKHTLQDQRQQRQKKRRKKERNNATLLNIEWKKYMKKKSAPNVRSVQMAKWKTIVVAWAKLSSRYIYSNTQTHTKHCWQKQQQQKIPMKRAILWIEIDFPSVSLSHAVLFVPFHFISFCFVVSVCALYVWHNWAINETTAITTTTNQCKCVCISFCFVWFVS